mgnify:CR=1 FL=1
MARMHPAELPISTVLDKSQQAVVTFYHALAQSLDDDFHVFYNCAVDGVEPEHDKSLDFAILHNKYGFLGIEVYQGEVPASNGRPGADQSNGKLKHLPYSQIRMVVHSFIFGLKERGIRFYIPAPCCVAFPNYVREEFEIGQDSADYLPLFQSDFSNLQNKIIAMMPVRGGHASNWSVKDAVDKIAPLIVFNSDSTTTGKSDRLGSCCKKRSVDIYGDDSGRPKIIYVVRAIDVFLVIINILVLAALVFFMPESFAQRVAEFLRH